MDRQPDHSPEGLDRNRGPVQIGCGPVRLPVFLVFLDRTFKHYSRPDRAQPDRLYLSLVSSSSPSLASSHMLPLPLSRSLRLTPLVLRLRQPYTT